MASRVSVVTRDSRSLEDAINTSSQAHHRQKWDPESAPRHQQCAPSSALSVGEFDISPKRHMGIPAENRLTPRKALALLWSRCGEVADFQE